jgi:hypothetical protein
MMATWRQLITKEMSKHGETWDTVVYKTVGPNVEEYYEPEEVRALAESASLDREFDAGYGGPDGDLFCVWTYRWVYFPIVYDGAEWCGSAPRFPCDTPLKHQGGW